MAGLVDVAVAQSLNVNTSTGDKFFNSGDGNPNLAKLPKVDLLTIAVFLGAIILVLWLVLR